MLYSKRNSEALSASLVLFERQLNTKMNALRVFFFKHIFVYFSIHLYTVAFVFQKEKKTVLKNSTENIHFNFYGFLVFYFLVFYFLVFYFLVFYFLILVFGLWFWFMFMVLVYGFLVYGFGLGFWFKVYGYGLWFIVLWFYGLWFIVL